MSDRFLIHSAADLRLLAWSAAEMNNNQDRMLQRKDRYGYPIHWEGYENEESQFGWFIELIDPEECEFGSNLHPVSYCSRQLTGGKDAAITNRMIMPRPPFPVAHAACSNRSSCPAGLRSPVLALDVATEVSIATENFPLLSIENFSL